MLDDSAEAALTITVLRIVGDRLAGAAALLPLVAQGASGRTARAERWRLAMGA